MRHARKKQRDSGPFQTQDRGTEPRKQRSLGFGVDLAEQEKSNLQFRR